MNPPVESLPAALIERLADCIPGNKNDMASIEMILDLEGYDTTDQAWVKACRARAAWTIRDQRAQHGALARIIAARLSNEEIGKAIGLPKSTVQAMGAGRVPERFTDQQRARFRRLLDLMAEAIESARAALGE
jgi:hypothetical protein